MHYIFYIFTQQHVCICGFPDDSAVKNLPAMKEFQVQSLCQEDPLEEGMVTHFSIFVWRFPWTEEPGRLWSTVSQSGTHVNPWLIHVNVWQKPLQYCKVISLQLIKINGKKKKSQTRLKQVNTAQHMYVYIMYVYI